MNDQKDKAGTDADWIEISDAQRHTSVDECKKYCIRTEFCKAVHYVYDSNNKHCFVYNMTTIVIAKDHSTFSEKHCVDTQSR